MQSSDIFMLHYIPFYEYIKGNESFSSGWRYKDALPLRLPRISCDEVSEFPWPIDVNCHYQSG